MIRFIPDSWRDALWRPIAMAAPDGGVYVETIAPDFRFVFALLLLAAWLVVRLRGGPGRRPTLLLLGFTALAFVPWLATSGNGRYFLPVLLLAGPLCVGLLAQLPIAPRVRLALVALMLGLQAFLVHENEPWNSWGLVRWTEPPAFPIEVPADLKERPGTYVSLSSISYSLIAPRFHPDSRWISLASQPGGPPDNVVGEWTRAFLQGTQQVHLLFPSLAGEGMTQKAPPEELVEALNASLDGHGFEIAPGPCRHLPSAGLTAMGSKLGAQEAAAIAEQRGFWLCPLTRLAPGQRRPQVPIDPQTEAAFNKVESSCPRLFPAGQAATTLLPAGARRFYVASDMRLYVLNEGVVMYKYMRALNAVTLGTIAQVLAPGFRMDCDNVRGRSGLPWERQI